MLQKIKKRFGSYHTFIILEDRSKLDLRVFQGKVSKGWLELSRLTQAVKVEFIRDFWLKETSYQPHVYSFLDRFFAKILDLKVLIVKKNEKDPLQSWLLYLFNEHYFLGSPPATDQDLKYLMQQIDFPFPEDYLKFLKIHNGFTKGMDTGIFQINESLNQKEFFQKEIEENPIYFEQKQVNPKELVPFYKSYDQKIYQCFFKDWYPDGQVGNVLCSLSEGRLSIQPDKLAFQTFLDWLVFYMSFTL